jgi:hypothetical protein
MVIASSGVGVRGRRFFVAAADLFPVMAVDAPSLFVAGAVLEAAVGFAPASDDAGVDTDDAGAAALAGTSASTGAGIGFDPGTAVAALALPTMSALPGCLAGVSGAELQPLTASADVTRAANSHRRVQEPRVSTGVASRDDVCTECAASRANSTPA